MRPILLLTFVLLGFSSAAVYASATHESMRWRQPSADVARGTGCPYTDGIVVLHRGNVVHERYFGVLTNDGQHAAISVTQSVVGTLGAMLVADGTLDARRKIADYVPELGQPRLAAPWAHAQTGNPRLERRAAGHSPFR